MARSTPSPGIGTSAKPHEWISFDDPTEQRTWLFDVTFLLSAWTCIFGRGCQGVLTGPAPEKVQGCCSYGAHFVDEADRQHTEAMAKRLRPDQWQFHAKGHRTTTKVNDEGDLVTKLAEDACIFLNRPGFAGGAGCALHRAALEAGERPLDWKPSVCWQLPLRREDAEAVDGRVLSTVRQWDRRHWGDGGQEFAWWCTEDHEAFVSDDPVYVHMRDEIVELTSEVAYALVAAHCERVRATALPHPAVAVDTASGAATTRVVVGRTRKRHRADT